MPWHLARKVDTGEGFAAYPDPVDAKHIAMTQEHVTGDDFEVVPIENPKPTEGVPIDGFARLAPIIPPEGLDQIRRFVDFDPAKHVTPEGTLSPIWETTMISRVQLPKPLAYLDGLSVTRISCHTRIVPAITLALEAVLRAGLWSVLEPYGGGFVPRFMRTSSGPRWSTHAFGLAFDFNPQDNWMGTPVDQTEFGRDAGQRVVEIMDAHGFYWGGNFTRPDAMHFQFCRGY